MAESTAETAPNAAELIDKYAGQLFDILQQSGPHAMDLANGLGAAGALSTILFGVVMAATAIACAVVVVKGVAAIIAANAPGVREDVFARGVIYGLFGLASLLVGSISFYHAVSSLTNIYAWAAFWRPEVFLAAKALGLI
jgi:hypothetical protein